jgi:outer membrane protein TolC
MTATTRALLAALAAVAILLASSFPALAQDAPLAAAVATAAAQAPATPAAGTVLTLPAAIELARTNNSRKQASGSAVEAADARQQQARSALWPQVNASLAYTHYDQAPNFVFPASSFAIPAMTMQVPPLPVTIPANAFGPGFPPVNVPLAVPGGAIQIPSAAVDVPEQNVRLLDPDILLTTLEAIYPIYTGGLARGQIARARAGAEAARQEHRATDAEVVYDTTRAYYGVVLARQMLATASDTLARMAATLDLTESLYKNGSGRVKKTDWLRNKAMVETIRTLVLDLQGRERNARAALAALVERGDGAAIDVADRELPFDALPCDMPSSLSRAASENPLVEQASAGLRAAEAGLDVARAGHLPKVGLFASASFLANAYDWGLATPDNRVRLGIGIGVDIPLFQGFRVVGEQAEARAAAKQMRQQLQLAKTGIAFETSRACTDMTQTGQAVTSTREALSAASENRELNVRAYQEDLVDTQDVIEAQLLEALLAGQHHKMLYDRLEAKARLERLFGGPAAPGK